MSSSVTTAQVVARLTHSTPAAAATDLLWHVASGADSVHHSIAADAAVLRGFAHVIERAERYHRDDAMNVENIIPQLCDLLGKLAGELDEHAADLADLGTAQAFVQGLRATAPTETAVRRGR